MASTLAAAAARRVAVLSSPKVSSQAVSFVQRRGLAGAAGKFPLTDPSADLNFQIEA